MEPFPNSTCVYTVAPTSGSTLLSPALESVATLVNAKHMIGEMLPTAAVLGLPVHLSGDYCTWLCDRLHQGAGTHVVTLNAEMAMLAQGNSELAAVIRGADLVVPDGAGVVFYLRLRDRQQPRCPGIELAAALLEVAAQCDAPNAAPRRIFFYGGAPGRAADAAATWQQRYPQLQVASEHGYLDETEQDALRDRLQQLQPQIVLVGLGVPRQEFWIARYRHLCPQAIWMGVGGSFDIWSGAKERAPRLWRDLNLEWLYRLYQEPWRWRRMGALPRFAWRAIVDRPPE